MKAKIKQTVLIIYLRDVVLPRTIEDATMSTLTSMEYFNRVGICEALHSDPQYVAELFSKLRADDRGVYREVVRLLKELCTMARSLQPPARARLYKVMTEQGFFGCLEQMLDDRESRLRASAVEILEMTVKHDSSLLRQHLLKAEGQKAKNFPFYRALVRVLAYDSEEGIQGQMADLLRNLVDPETMETTPEKDEFLDIFYMNFMGALVGALGNAASPSAAAEAAAAAAAAAAAPGDTAAGSKAAAELLEAQSQFKAPIGSAAMILICELLSFCVQHHSYRIRYFILKNNVVQQVLGLLKIGRPDKTVILACIR